jgi:hypothetical protein
LAEAIASFLFSSKNVIDGYTGIHKALSSKQNMELNYLEFPFWQLAWHDVL